MDLDTPTSTEAVATSPQDFAVKFHGKAGEYFKIAIVNLALTIITLGIYLPWAKVRTRRYFYANTELDGQRFDFLADPLKMLKGYLLVGLGIVIFNVSQYFKPELLPVLLLAIWGIAPFLIQRSLRFRLHNTSFRNVRFGFTGSVGKSYVLFLLWPFLYIFSLGLAYPLWHLKQNEYFFGCSRYGTKKFNFKGNAGSYYKYYLIAVAMGMGVFMAFMIVAAIVMGIAGVLSGMAAHGEPTSSAEPAAIVMLLIAVPFYVILICSQIGIGSFIQGSLFVYNFSVLSHDTSNFQSTLKIGKYAWIAISNLFVTLFTLGLMGPWARIRITKFLIESITVKCPEGSFGKHLATHSKDESATGDAAADYMDFDIGL